MFPHLSHKIQVVPNSIDFNDISTFQKQNVLFLVSSFTKKEEGKYIKGTDFQIEAFQIWLNKTGLNVLLYIAGDCPEFDKIKKNSLCRNIVF